MIRVYLCIEDSLRRERERGYPSPDYSQVAGAEPCHEEMVSIYLTEVLGSSAAIWTLIHQVSTPSVSFSRLIRVLCLALSV